MVRHVDHGEYEISANSSYKSWDNQDLPLARLCVLAECDLCMEYQIMRSCKLRFLPSENASASCSTVRW